MFVFADTDAILQCSCYFMLSWTVFIAVTLLMELWTSVFRGAVIRYCRTTLYTCKTHILNFLKHITIILFGYSAMHFLFENYETITSLASIKFLCYQILINAAVKFLKINCALKKIHINKMIMTNNRYGIFTFLN